MNQGQNFGYKKWSKNSDVFYGRPFCQVALVIRIKIWIDWGWSFHLTALIYTQGRHGEFEPGKAQNSTPNFFDRLFLIRAYWNPKSRQGPGLGGLASRGGPAFLSWYCLSCTMKCWFLLLLTDLYLFSFKRDKIGMNINCQVENEMISSL